MSRLAWFPFYVDDFLGGTNAMLPAELGAYLSAMLAQWQSGEHQAIPDDPVRLARICGLDPFPPAVRAKFELVVINDKPFLRNAKLASVWEKQKGAHDAQAAAGKQTGNLNAKHNAKHQAKHNAKPLQNPEPRTHILESRETERRTQENTMSPNGDVLVIFEYWKEIHGHPKARLDEKRKRLVIHALKEYSVEDLKKAIDGCKLSPHHQGQNDRGMVYDDIELICRDSKHVEQFMNLATNGLVRPPDPYEAIARLHESYGNQEGKDKPIH